MKCACCDTQKAELKPRKSVLLPGVNLMLCASCIKSGYEPRWVVILSARRYGKQSVSKYINDRKYCGRPILAEEIVT